MNSTASLAKTWGEGIRKARTELGLSIVELAARVGIDPAHLSRGERGLAGIGDDYRMAIARELGRSVPELFPYPSATDQETAGGVSQCPSPQLQSENGS